MSSRKGQKLVSAGSSGSLSKGNVGAEKYSAEVDQLGKGIASVSLNAGQDGGWEVFSKKSKNKAGNTGGKQWASQNSTSNAWGNLDTAQKLGLHSDAGPGKGSASAWPTTPNGSKNSAASTPAFPPLKSGWDWSRRAKDGTNRYNNVEGVNPQNNEDVVDDRADDDEGDEDGVLVDDSDDEFQSDDYDSDASEKSHEVRTKSRWFKELFECMDSLTVEQINDPERQWHCPACKGGPGAIDWYRGLQPLIAHAKTKGSVRVKLHRELAVLLDEELRRRGTSAIPAGEIFGQWKGLEGAEKEIVWPPMVIIMNTRLDKDDNEKWTGMGNQELLAYFEFYNPQKARHSYGPQGHRGMSVLIFEPSAVGYLAAESMGKKFEADGRDRAAWDRRRGAFYTGGWRDLYGYIAEKKDMDNFNQHSPGKSKLKFEIKSYQEMVVRQLKQMNEENQQLIWLRNKVAKEKQDKMALAESYGIVTERLRKTSEENRIIRERTKKHHADNIEEMEFQEQFFKEQLKMVHEARKEKEESFEKIQLEGREKMKHTSEDDKSRVEEINEVMEDLEMEFAAKKALLLESHEDKKLDLKRRHNEEEVSLEEEYNAQLSKLYEMYNPSNPRPV